MFFYYLFVLLLFVCSFIICLFFYYLSVHLLFVCSFIICLFFYYLSVLLLFVCSFIIILLFYYLSVLFLFVCFFPVLVNYRTIVDVKTQMPFSKYLISWYIWICIADNNSPSLSPPSGAQAPPLCGWLPWLPERLGSSPTSHPTSSMSTRRLKIGQWGESSFPSNLWNLLFSCSLSVFHFVTLYLFINYI